MKNKRIKGVWSDSKIAEYSTFLIESGEHVKKKRILVLSGILNKNLHGATQPI